MATTSLTSLNAFSRSVGPYAFGVTCNPVFNASAANTNADVKPDTDFLEAVRALTRARQTVDRGLSFGGITTTPEAA